MSTSRLAVVLLGAAMAAGCATSDYGRITDKIAAYEAEAAATRAEMQSAKDPGQKLRGYNTLISLTRKELEIARRINPDTNPAFRSGSMTAEQARAEKDARVAKLEAQLGQQVKDRDAMIMSQAPAHTDSKPNK